MNPERWRRINEVFAAAIEADGEGREHVLEEECGSDSSLRSDVERLLLHHDTDSNRLDRLQARVASLHGASRASSLPPDKILAGRFRVVRFLGAGGMGEVYEALDQELNTGIALKKLHDDLAGDAKILARFKQEIQMARRVTHPNVCRVFDMFRHEESGRSIHFLTMELIDGETLSKRIRRDGPMNTDGALVILRQLTAGLSAAHAAKVVHRDFKSGNVMIDPKGRVIVTDFGMARDLAPEAGRTLSSSSSVALGTPAYMAPEQIAGKTASAETDIYALGVVTYEMVTGVLPYTDRTPLALAAKKVSQPPRPPREVRPDLPPLWEGVILRCLERNPQDRFSSALQVTAALDSGQPPRRLRLVKRKHWIAAIAALFLCAVGFGVWRWYPAAADPQSIRIAKKGAESLLLGSHQQAGPQLNAAIRLDPDSVAPHAWLVMLSVQMEDYGAASNAMQEASRLLQRGARVAQTDMLLVDAARLVMNGKLLESARQLSAARSLGQGEKVSLLLCAASLYFRKAGATGEALSISTQAVEAAKEYPLALLENASARAVSGAMEEALPLFRKAQEEFELDNRQAVTEVELRRAEALLHVNRQEEARQCLERAVSNAQVPEDAERLARAYILLGRRQDAVDIAKRSGIRWLRVP